MVGTDLEFIEEDQSANLLDGGVWNRHPSIRSMYAGLGACPQENV